MAAQDVRQFLETDVTSANGMYAVFRKPHSSKRAQFACVKDTYDEAEAEAVRLLSIAVATNPQQDHIYFVIQIIGYVSRLDGEFKNGSIFEAGA